MPLKINHENIIKVKYQIIAYKIFSFKKNKDLFKGRLKNEYNLIVVRRAEL